MAEQMSMHGVHPRVRFPWWGWLRYGSGSGKPDLRCSGLLPQGSLGVLLQLELARGEILLSQFEMWTWALNNAFVPEGYSGCEDAEQKQRLGTLDQAVIEASWERMFNLCSGDDEFWGQRSNRWIQACFPVLRESDVRGCKRFTAR